MNVQNISKREKEVLVLISDEYSTKEIADQLNISKHTADSHRKNLIIKFGVKNTAGLITKGFRRGILYCLLLFLIPASFNVVYSQVDLELSNSIKIGNSNTEETGNIRWNENSQDFEGWNGSSWVSFTKARIVQNDLNDTTNILPLCADTVISDGSQFATLIGSGVGLSGTNAVVKKNDPSSKLEFYSFTNNKWAQDTLITPNVSSSGIDDPVVMIDSVVAVGFPNSNTDGRVGIFSMSNNKWGIDTLLEQSGSSKFGKSVAFNNTFYVIGAPATTVSASPNEGAVYIYKRAPGNWLLHAQIDNPDIATYSRFGEAVHIADNFLYIGEQSSTHIYSITGDIISPFQILNFTGRSFASNNSYTAVGDWFYFENGSNEGKVIMLDNSINSIVDTFDLDIADHLFGSAMSMSGDFLFITAMSKQDQGDGKKGIVYIYHYDNDNWNQVNTLEDPVGGTDDQFGHSLQLNGSNYIIGSPRADVNGKMDKGKFFIGTLK